MEYIKTLLETIKYNNYIPIFIHMKINDKNIHKQRIIKRYTQEGRLIPMDFIVGTDKTTDEIYKNLPGVLNDKKISKYYLYQYINDVNPILANPLLGE